MAGGKGRKELGKPDGNTLSAIDRALRDIASNTDLHPDEFTIGMLLKREPKMARETIKKKLAAMTDSGELSARSVILNGVRMNAFRYL